jgi:hypothetical protein
VSDEALREWERDRMLLAADGYPDRPPEVDTRNVRGWDTGTPAHQSDIRPNRSVTWLGMDHSAEFLGAWRTGADEVDVKVLVGRRKGGVFALQVTVRLGRTQKHVLVECGDEIAARAWIDGLDHALVAALGLPPLSWVSADELSAELLGR